MSYQEGMAAGLLVIAGMAAASIPAIALATAWTLMDRATGGSGREPSRQDAGAKPPAVQDAPRGWVDCS